HPPGLHSFPTRRSSDLQAVQMTFFFFLPNFLLSGFAFPFRGMPQWAQWIGEVLPLIHFIRIVRGIMLKGNGFADMQMDVAALAIDRKSTRLNSSHVSIS